MSSIWQAIVLDADTCCLAFLVSPYLSMTMNYDFEMIASLCLLIVYLLIFFVVFMACQIRGLAFQVTESWLAERAALGFPLLKG